MSKKKNVDRLVGIYKITCLVNGRIYIGATTDSYKRFEKHKWMLQHNQHSNSDLQNAWNKYGEENFAFNWVTECSKEERFSVETAILKEYGWPDRTKIFNFESGGIKNKHISNETKQKISVFNKGKHLSDEHKTKLRLAKLGKKGHSPTQEQKIAASTRMKNKKPNTNSLMALQKSNLNHQTAILQFDLSGRLIKEWEGINLAARATNSQSSLIHKCCNGIRSKHNGFIWKYKKDVE